MGNSKVTPTILTILNISMYGSGKPFARFNEYIHNSKYREEWFSFRQKQLENYVRRLMLDFLENNKKNKRNK